MISMAVQLDKFQYDILIKDLAIVYITISTKGIYPNVEL